MPVPWSFSQTTTTTSTSTTASSPSPNSTPPNFTDWLHISPAPQSAVSSMAMMSPFQDLSSSARINLGLQEPEHCLHYLCHISDSLDFNKSPASVIPTCLSPSAIFNSHHHRMLSLDSTTTTLIDSPLPGSLSLFAPTVERQSQSPRFLSSPSTSLFASSASSASKFIEDLQTSVSPFGNYFGDSAMPFTSFPLEDISPVVRADTLQESLVESKKMASGQNKLKNRNRRNQSSSFVQKLRSVTSPATTLIPYSLDLLEESVSQRLLSPCKLVPSTSNNNLQILSVDNRPVLDIPTSPLSDVSGSFAAAPLPFSKDSTERDISSQLTPLTPLPSSPRLSPSSPPHPPLKIVLKLKRKSIDEFPTTPPRRSKRSRRPALIPMQLSPLTNQSSSTTVPELSPQFNPTDLQNHRRPVYTNRKLPETIEISANYPLFYRRFPASRHFQIDDSEYSLFRFFFYYLDQKCSLHIRSSSPEVLFGAEHPGGLYNPPRGALDLYTPRFVKGKGVEKVGLCPICVEPYERGGESKRLWLAMKFSAFKWYHLFFFL